MKKNLARISWIACSVAGAILAGCISEVADATAETATLGAKAQRGGDALSADPNSAMAERGGCACPDTDGNGRVDIVDLAEFLAVYGTSTGDSCLDLDGSGFVDLPDLSQMMAQYGSDCGSGSGNSNANGANGNTNSGNENTNGDNGNTNADNGNTNGGNNNANGANGNANGGDGNTNANGGNGNTNGDNGNANGGNGNANGGNGNANGGNENANGGNGNSNANGGNGNANGGNGNANGGGGTCGDGSTQVEAALSGDDHNEARYRAFPNGCKHFRARVRELAAFTTYNVVIEGIVVGQITTDDDGRGELEYDSPNFPAGFPDVLPGDVITIGPAVGAFFSDCSSNANCNG